MRMNSAGLRPVRCWLAPALCAVHLVLGVAIAGAVRLACGSRCGCGWRYAPCFRGRAPSPLDLRARYKPVLSQREQDSASAKTTFCAGKQKNGLPLTAADTGG